jgi:hypothetical protein
MSERESGAAQDHPPAFEDFQVIVESDSAQRHDHSEVRQQIEFPLQVGPAIPEFLQSGFVSRWSAVRRGGDIGVYKREPIVARYAGWL